MGPGYSADQSALVAHLNRVVPQDLRLNSGRLPNTMKAQWSLLVSYHSSNFQDSFWLSTLIRRASTDLRHSMGAIWCHGTSMHAEMDMQHTQHSPQVAVQHGAHPKETYVAGMQSLSQSLSWPSTPIFGISKYSILKFSCHRKTQKT